MKTSKEIKENMLKMRADYMNAAQIEFKEAANGLFDKYPRLKSFSFEAYTNFFNDGDTCYFAAYVDYPDINGFRNSENYGEDEDIDGLEDLVSLGKRENYDSSSGKFITNPNCDMEAATIYDEVKNFLRAFDYDFYKEMFGDHVRITVTKDKIETEEYTDHD